MIVASSSVPALGCDEWPGCTSGKDVFRAFMVEGASFAGAFDFPVLAPVHVRITRAVSFPEAMSSSADLSDVYVHFYTDDFRFERIWNSPSKYLPRLKTAAGVIEPDFSTCPNFPEALKVYNGYRNRACAYWLQRNGITVVPNVRCDVESSVYALAGLPNGSTIAIGSHGCIKQVGNRERFKASLKIAVDTLEPSNIIAFGSDGYDVFEYPRSRGIEVSVIPIERKSCCKERA